MNENLISQIENTFEQTWFQNIIKTRGQNSEKTSDVSEIIGEAYIYAFSTQSCENIQEFLTKLLENFDKIKEEAINPKDKAYQKNQTRANMLLTALAKKMGIPESQIEQSEELRIAFLENYCKNGFVMHSFSEENLENLKENGFQSSEERKQTNIGTNEIIEIAHIFENHGVLKACGTYPFYSGAGLYVEHDPRKVFEHSTLAPECFFEFTGSDHNGLDSAVATHPLITRDYDACKQNVEDLCENAELSEDEKSKVYDFFERNWERYGNGQKYVAMIPRSVIGKEDYSAILENSKNKSNTELVSALIGDEFQIFQEHVGNVVKHGIDADKFSIIKLPDAKEIFKSEFTREKKSELIPSPAYLAHVRKYAESSNFDMEYVDDVISKISEYWNERTNTNNGKNAKLDVIEAAKTNTEHRIENEQLATKAVKKSLLQEKSKEDIQVEV